MAKICLDPGHGLNTPGKRTPKPVPRYGRVVREYEANKLYATYQKKALERHGHTIVWTGGDNDPSLSARCSEANRADADLFISDHWNAGGGTGTETFVYGRGGQAEKLAKLVQPRLVKALGFRDRGVRVENFHVLRETKMPAILIEHGFMDDPSGNDQQFMLDHKKAAAAAEAVAQAVQAFYGKPYKPPEDEKPEPKPAPKPVRGDNWIRVSHNGEQVGAFKEPENAVREVGKYVKPGVRIDVKLD